MNCSLCLQASGKSVTAIDSEILAVEILVGDGEKHSISHVAIIDARSCKLAALCVGLAYLGRRELSLAC